MLFLVQHWITVGDCLPNILTIGTHRSSSFRFLHQRFYSYGQFCSHAYRTDVDSEHLLHRQVSRAQENVESRLEITLADAHVYQQSYFP